jgi:hypothetical protein
MAKECARSGQRRRGSGGPGYAGASFVSRPNDHMTTPLDRSIKRELELDGTSYTVTISPEGIKVTEKGKRKGQEITWRDIISGDAALRRDLKLSVQALSSDQ